MSRSHKTAHTRSEVRHKLRKELTELTEHRETLADPENDEILAYLERSREIFDQIDHPREAAIDSQCMTVTSDLSHERSTRIRTGFHNYDIGSFVRHFNRRHLEGDGPLQSRLAAFGGELLRSDWRVVCGVPVVGGDVTVREPRERRTVQKTDIGEAVRPKTSKAGDWNVAAETPERVNQVERCLRAHGPVPLYEFVCNPRSFSQTVENLFYCSFLVKEWRAKIVMKKNVPVIAPMDKPEGRPDGLSQTVCVMTYEMWDAVRAGEGPDFAGYIPNRMPSVEVQEANLRYSQRPSQVSESQTRKPPRKKTSRRKET